MEKLTNFLMAFIMVGCLFGYAHHLGYTKGVSETEMQYSTEVKIEQQRALNNSLAIEKKHSSLLIEKENEYKKIISNRDALIDELRKRPRRPKEISVITTSTSSCSGRELYAEDAEFLAREAARADKIIVERNYYYEMYKQVKDILDGN